MADIIQTPPILVPTLNTGILSYALNIAPNGTTVISPRNMSVTSELPNASYQYGTAIIAKRSATALSVTLVTDANSSAVATNAYNAGNSAWVGWKMCGGAYFNNATTFWDTVSSSATGCVIEFSMSGAVSNSVFGLGSNSSAGNITVVSSTVAMGTLTINNNETYSFWLNPSTQTLTNIFRLTREVQIYSQASAVSHSFNIPNSYRGMVFTSDTSDTYAGMYILSASSTGSTHVFTVKSASNITPSESTNKITFTLAASRAMVFTFTNSYGEVTVAT